MIKDFNEYQKAARESVIYPDSGKFNGLSYTVHGLTGEAGEVAGKVSKLMRDKDYAVTETDKQEIAKELGDVLWYLANAAHEIGYSLSTIATDNINKLRSRKERNQLKGNGDNR